MYARTEILATGIIDISMTIQSFGRLNGNILYQNDNLNSVQFVSQSCVIVNNICV